MQIDKRFVALIIAILFVLYFFDVNAALNNALAQIRTMPHWQAASLLIVLNAVTTVTLLPTTPVNLFQSFFQS